MWITNLIAKLVAWLAGDTPYTPPKFTSMMYKGYRIQPNPYQWMNDEFIFAHEDYDGPGDNRCGTAATIEAAKYEIDQICFDEELDGL